MGAYSTVDCHEVFGTVQEERSNVSWTASVTLQCTWANRYNLINDLVTTPRQWPQNANLYCNNAQITPAETKYTASGQEIVYEDAFITAQYAIPGGPGGSIPQDPVNLYSEELAPYTQVIRLPYQRFVWASDDANLISGQEPGKVIHGIKLVRTLFYVQTINPVILELPGTIHNASYYSTILAQTFEANSLLFMPPVMSRTITTAGATAWNLKLAWDYRKEGWNSVWRVDKDDVGGIGGEYDTLKVKQADGNHGPEYKSYKEKNHGAFLF